MHVSCQPRPGLGRNASRWSFPATCSRHCHAGVGGAARSGCTGRPADMRIQDAGQTRIPGRCGRHRHASVPGVATFDVPAASVTRFRCPSGPCPFHVHVRKSSQPECLRQIMLCSCPRAAHTIEESSSQLHVSVPHPPPAQCNHSMSQLRLGNARVLSLNGAGGPGWRAVLLPKLLRHGHAHSSLAGMQAACRRIAACPCRHTQAVNAEQGNAFHIHSICISADAFPRAACRRQGCGSRSRRSSRWCRSRAARATRSTPPCATSMRALTASGERCCLPCAAAKCAVNPAHAQRQHSVTLA